MGGGVMAVSIDGAGSLTGLDAVDVPVYADATARNAAIATPVAGQIVFVTGTGSLVYNGTGWVALGAGDANFTNTATGTYTDGGIDYKYITFTGSGSLVVDRAGFADILLVGGGAGGGVAGGGAGGHSEQNVYLKVGTLTVTVGAGGAYNGAGSNNGLPSRLDNYIALAGGGSTPNLDGGAGGSGGGGQGAGVGGAGLFGQGNNGGNPLNGQSQGGAGGGAGAVGSNASGVPPNRLGGAGGAGVSSSITGGAVTRGGGGGGGGDLSSAGGTGGGGDGAGAAVGTAGAANTGGGGGGGYLQSGASGGSGVVIVRVAI